MKAHELMTADPFAVTPYDTLARAAQLMRDLKVGSIPVVEDQLDHKLVGIITDRDIAVRCVAEGLGPDYIVGDNMTAMPLQTVEADADQMEVIRKMEDAQVRRIPVIADDNRLVGIITQADIASKLGPREPLLIEEVMLAVSAPAALVS